uniref:protein YIPF1-like isoform X1 n=1 Tax=Myxine glutinosa TaxID=7769 RepID=UPI00358F9C6C
MASADEFDFEEFNTTTRKLSGSPDSRTLFVDEGKESIRGRIQVEEEDTEEELIYDEGVRTELLAGQKKSSSFWTFSYYQTFFDVDTWQVLNRIKGSMIPLPKRNFVRHYIRNKPDLYGPFWICATLVFAISISGNLSNFLVHRGESGFRYTPEFQKVSIAATAVYAYAWLVPLVLWGCLVWWHGHAGAPAPYSFLELVCTYGYCLSSFIPAALLWLIPIEPMRWVLLVLACLLSGGVLAVALWPVLRRYGQHHAAVALVFLLLLHIGLGLGCKLYFFDAPQAVPETSQTTHANNATVQQSQ